MKMTEQEEKLIGVFRSLENEKNKDDLIFQAATMVRAQEAMKADYGPEAKRKSKTGQQRKTAS